MCVSQEACMCRTPTLYMLGIDRYATFNECLTVCDNCGQILNRQGFFLTTLTCHYAAIKHIFVRFKVIRVWSTERQTQDAAYTQEHKVTRARRTNPSLGKCIARAKLLFFSG